MSKRDIVERLDTWRSQGMAEEGNVTLLDEEWGDLLADITEAANEIERLRAEVERAAA
jgi:hypothetical protein